MTVSGLKHFAAMPPASGAILGVAFIGDAIICSCANRAFQVSPDGNVSEIRTHADNRGAIRVLDTPTSDHRNLSGLGDSLNRGDELNA